MHVINISKQSNHDCEGEWGCEKGKVSGREGNREIFKLNYNLKSYWKVKQKQANKPDVWSGTWLKFYSAMLSSHNDSLYWH